jgi:hypothetical protein
MGGVLYLFALRRSIAHRQKYRETRRKRVPFCESLQMSLEADKLSFAYKKNIEKADPAGVFWDQ